MGSSHKSDSLERDRDRNHKSSRRDESSSRRSRRDVDDTEDRQRRDRKDDKEEGDDNDRRDSRRDRDHRRRGGGDRKSDDSGDHPRSKDEKRRRRESSDASDSESEVDEDRRRRRHRSKSSKKKRSRRRRDDDKRRKKRKKKSYSSSSSSSSDSSSSSSESEDDDKRTTKKVVNKKLLEKLAARGETLEEWRERKSQKRATRIAAKFGYTAEDNPFNDANLHETFTWKKKEEKAALNKDKSGETNKADHVFDEIEKVRQRRKDRELQFEEMERIRAEESRMKELENYDEWARKEEEFHLAQQRQRSAIRLVEGREKPIDVLAKNLLLFGLSEEDRNSRGSVKYQERYNALNALESVEAELEEPQNLLKVLKQNELEELLVDIQAFQSLEREASAGQAGLQNDNTNAVLKYWEGLKIVAEDEIKYLKTGGSDGSHAKMVADVQKIFESQSFGALTKMKGEVAQKLRDNATSGAGFGAEETQDSNYWRTVLEQLVVYLAKMELSELHSKMLVCQLEKLEQKKEELSKKTAEGRGEDSKEAGNSEGADNAQMVPTNVAPDFGNLEEELGLTDEIDVHAQNYSWSDKYRPRKPRYFNRVKTGYDWNKYNQTHYDHDNPPPKTVQGYKFNIFYPDLIDPTKTPQYFLEKADSDEFCILRFHAGPPYEDIAFKIINREWNRSRKRGFRCTFERGVLSLYFNFSTHWYRR